MVVFWMHKHSCLVKREYLFILPGEIEGQMIDGPPMSGWQS